MATKQADKVEEVKEAKREVFTLATGISQCNEILGSIPDALDFGVQKDVNGNHFHAFTNNTNQAQKAREEIGLILREVYDNGAYSFGDFARRLRVESLSIQALLDEEFKENNNL